MKILQILNDINKKLDVMIAKLDEHTSNDVNYVSQDQLLTEYLYGKDTDQDDR